MLDTGAHVHHVVRMHQTEHVSVVEAARILGWSRWTVTRALKDPAHPLTGAKLGDTEVSPWLLKRCDVEALRDEIVAKRARLAAEAAEVAS